MSNATIAAISEANRHLVGTTIAPIELPTATRRTLSGGRMPITAGSITDGQISRLQGCGIPLTNKVRAMSMADASDLYFALKR